VMKGKSPEADGENAPTIVTKTPLSGSGALIVSGMTAEDIAACRVAGMTDDEIKANGPSAGKE